jgi:hypothetical protein
MTYQAQMLINLYGFGILCIVAQLLKGLLKL